MPPGCPDTSFWDSKEHKCLLCISRYKIQAGFEFEKNCGWFQNHQAKPVYKRCRNGTFNNGSYEKCQICSRCVTPQFIACSSTSDTICCKQGEQVFNRTCIPQPLPTTVTTTVSLTSINTSVGISITSPNPTATPTSTPTTQTSTSTPTPTPFQSPSQNPHTAIDVTGMYTCLGILSILTLVCLFLVIKRRRNNHLNEEFQKHKGAIRESLSKKGINRYEQSISYNIIKESDNNDHIAGLASLLAPEIQNAPLKTVLNNLDVLEELVLVLDPDISGAKNTRHLAAQCSFSFAWINYAYSMKDHKSPLVAVLEGVVTKNPDWTVGHLAELLTAISRNDAVEILAHIQV